MVIIAATSRSSTGVHAPTGEAFLQKCHVSWICATASPPGQARCVRGSCSAGPACARASTHCEL